MCHKKVEKMMKIVKIVIFRKMIPHHPGNISRPKKSNFDEEIDVFKIKIPRARLRPFGATGFAASYGGHAADVKTRISIEISILSRKARVLRTPLP